MITYPEFSSKEDKMNHLHENIGYLRGLAEGLEIEDKKNGRVILAIIDCLDEMTYAINQLDQDLIHVEDIVDEIDDDLSELEEAVLDLDEEIYGMDFDDEYDEFDDFDYEEYFRMSDQDDDEAYQLEAGDEATCACSESAE